MAAACLCLEAGKHLIPLQIMEFSVNPTLFQKRAMATTLHDAAPFDDQDHITMGIIAMWGLPALWMTGGAYWKVGIGFHIIDRGLGALHKRITLPFYYVITAPLSLCPWFPWLLIGLWKAWRCRDDKRAFLLSWMLGPYLVFGFYATQLPHDVLPAFPAIFLLGFRHKRQSHEGRIWVHAYYGLYAVIVVGGVGLLAFSGNGGQMLAVKLCVGGLLGILMCYLIFALCVERQKWLGAVVSVFIVPAFNLHAGSIDGCICPVKPGRLWQETA